MSLFESVHTCVCARVCVSLCIPVCAHVDVWNAYISVSVRNRMSLLARDFVATKSRKSKRGLMTWTLISEQIRPPH